MKPIIIAYDIRKNKIRSRILRILKGWRLDGQKSVHECRLTLKGAEKLFLQLSDPLDPGTDCLMMAWLELHRKVLCRGIGRNRFDNRIDHIR